ncbi:MAG: hypothetical protein G3I10_09495 [Ferrovum sp.]|nr:hypothetical protein [Ferrovum sp.]
MLDAVGMCWADWYAGRGGLPAKQQKSVKKGHALSVLAEQLSLALIEAVVLFNNLMPPGECPERARLAEIARLLETTSEEMRRAS